MSAHMPNKGFVTQLDVLVDCIEKRFDDMQSLADPQDVSAQIAFEGLRMLCQTHQALAADFETAALDAIGAISRLQASADISTLVANQLMATFELALGDAYVATIAANTAEIKTESGV